MPQIGSIKTESSENKHRLDPENVDNVITNAESAPAGTFTSNEGAQLCLNPMYIEDNLKKVETFCDFEKDSNGLELDKQMKSSPLVNQMEPSMEVFVCKNMKNQIKNHGNESTESRHHIKQWQPSENDANQKLPDKTKSNHNNVPDIRQISRPQSTLHDVITPDQKILQNFDLLNEELLARERGIRDIEETMLEVHEIFGDLGVIVSEQQGLLDNVESNIESIAVQTRAGLREILIAKDRQRRRRRSNFVCCFLLIIFALIMLFGIYYSV